MDPESSDSDVSVVAGDDYHYAHPLTAPAPLPAPPSKHALESSDAVQARLEELTRVEEYNLKKLELLKAKRKRKDDKMRRKREIQDLKIKAIYEARERRDARITARRQREDAAFLKFEQDLDEEETVRDGRILCVCWALTKLESSPSIEAAQTWVAHG